MKQLYVIGDSISMQYGPYLERHLASDIAYSRKDEQAPPDHSLDFPSGANGGDSSMVLAYLQEMKPMLADKDLVLFNCGLHDIKVTGPDSGEQVHIGEYELNLKGIVSLLHSIDCKPVWVSTTEFDESRHNELQPDFKRYSSTNQVYHQMAIDIMAAESVPILNLRKFTSEIPGDLFEDHVHFHDFVRQLQGSYLAGWLNAFCLKSL